ncbi:MAG: M20 family metallo-hydrolase [Bacteroidetes bacterium]|nr:M20 family metallo-hydrolase [Bacteroidota bacterium]
MDIHILKKESIELLKQLVSTPSFSSEEMETAALIISYFGSKKIEISRNKNNVWVHNKYFNELKPTILLNSHHDTVRPNEGYKRDPFDAQILDGKLFGLGSNDAGASLVSLLALFMHFYEREDLKYNLIFSATGEEESSGTNGLNSILQYLPELDFAVVGEPTGMQLAIAEKGLLVIDAYAPGIAGHAAHSNTDNAIYNAIQDIDWIRNYEFSEISELLGKVKMTVTQIDAGREHNVVPGTCHFTIDVRVTEKYSNREVFKYIDKHTISKLKARSFNLNSSSINPNHAIVKAGVESGRKTYGSPTLSDQSVLDCPSLKLGPGESTRSHQADEFIKIEEINEAIDLYIKIFDKIL